MAIPKQKFREVVFLLLYAGDTSKDTTDELPRLIMKELSVSKTTMRDAEERLKSLTAHLNDIDKLIKETSTAYEFERIHSVERNVLRLGIFELLHDEEIPPKVAIAEAIRLSKKFGSPESLTFVNAIMDKIYQSSVT